MRGLLPIGRLVTGVAVVCLMTGCAGDTAPGDEPAAPAAGSRPAAGPLPDRPEAAAAGVLTAWAQARAAAYAAGDAEALRDLYVRGSTAARADLRVLRAYDVRGLRVEGMTTQLLEVEVLSEGPRSVRLQVVDRLVGAEAVDVRTGRRTALPRDRADRRVIELRRDRGRWLVASVSP